MYFNELLTLIVIIDSQWCDHELVITALGY